METHLRTKGYDSLSIVPITKH